MNLKEVASKLRKAADMLEDLVGLNLDRPTKNETKKVAEKILKKKYVAWQHLPGNEKKAAAWRKMMSDRNKGKRK